MRRQNLDPLPHVGALGKLHVIAVVRDASRLEQIRCGKILQRNVNARRKRPRGRSFARHLSQRARDGEFQITDLDRVAHLGMELEQEAFLGEGAGANAEIARGGRGNRFHRAVKWEIATQRADMHEPGGIAAWKNGHAREANFTRLRFA